jgi:hypothetical protein
VAWTKYGVIHSWRTPKCQARTGTIEVAVIALRGVCPLRLPKDGRGARPTACIRAPLEGP